MQNNSAAFRLAVMETLAWTKLLSEEELYQFLDELTESCLVDNSALAQTIAAWQHTAEVYSDPELAALLRSET